MIPIVDPSTRVPVGCYGKADFVLPDHALSQLSKMIPNLLRPQWGGALYQLAKVVFTIVASYFVLVNLPWFLLPIGWILVASSLTGLFAIAHDCSHDNYTPSSLINRLIGEIASLPLLQSFEVFKLRHSKTHATKMKALAAKNNKSFDDKQSLLLSEEDKKKAKKAELLQEERAEMLEETPIGSLVSFISDTFFPSLSAVSNRCSFIFSLSLSYLFFVAAIPALCYFIGFSLVVKFYFIPLICFYAMRSSFFSMLYTKFTNAMLPMSLSASIPSYSIRSVCKEILKVQEETRTSLSSFSIRDYISWFKNDIYPRLDWLHVIILFSVPIFGFYGATFTPLLKPTLYFSIFYYMCSGLGITAGYHRLFAHKAYEASPFWTVILGLMGTSALEGSIKWWCGGHRVHHRHTDTDKDPYNAKSGFWYAHIGWMLVKQKAEHRVKSDISDLNRSAFIRFQHKYYLFVGPFMAIIFPTLVCGLLWGDWQGGYFYAGLIRLFFVHHSTFCVNSVAHYLGEQSFDDMRTPRDSLITAFLTFGEGYHNFHHEFPNDYRNGIRWYDYDPTKWLILALHYIGSAFHLKKFSENEIRMGQWLMKQKQADELKENILFPAPVDNLPEWSMEEVTEKVNNQSSKLIIIHGLIYDIEEFIPMHPGGAAHLTTSVGKDASDKFEGKSGIYKHSNAARNFLQRYRVAKLAGAKVIDHVKHD